MVRRMAVREQEQERKELLAKNMDGRGARPCAPTESLSNSRVLGQGFKIIRWGKDTKIIFIPIL
jgi:hypothetical protein